MWNIRDRFSGRFYLKVFITLCVFAIFGSSSAADGRANPESDPPLTTWILDNTFGDNGTISFRPDYPIVSSHYYKMFVLHDGRILVPYLYQWSYGGPDSGSEAVLLVIGIDGTFEGLQSWDEILIIGVQSDDKFVAREWNNGSPILTRYNPDLSPDPTFAAPSEIEFNCCSWAVLPDDRIVITSSDENFIVRLNSDGSLDETFPNGVGPFHETQSLTAHLNGGFLVQESYTTAHFCSARIFDNSGILSGYLYNTTTHEPNNFCHLFIHFAPYPGGGYSWIDIGRTVYRSSESGSLLFEIPVQAIIDQSFGPGWSIEGAAPVTVQLDGKTVFSGRIRNSGLNYWYLGRLNPDGSPDTTFGINGVYAWPAPVTWIGNEGTDWKGGLTVLPDGRILVIGSEGGTLYLARVHEMEVEAQLFFPIVGR